MALETIKKLFTKEVNTEGLTTSQFMQVLQNEVPGSGYDKIQTLRHGIAINENRLTPEDEKRRDDIVTIAIKSTKVANPALFKEQLESYIRTGEVLPPVTPKEVDTSILHLDEDMRSNAKTPVRREPLSTEVLKEEASKLGVAADDFLEKFNAEHGQKTVREKTDLNNKHNPVDQAHVDRAQKANNPHGFEEIEPVKRTGT